MTSRLLVWMGCAGVVLGACGDDGGRGDAATTTTMPTPGATDTPTPTTGATGDVSGTTTTGATDSADDSTTLPPTTTQPPTTTSTTTGTSTSTTGDAPNSPPVWDSEPSTSIVLVDIFQTEFDPGQIFLASSRTDEIRVYDGNSLAFLEAFTHPEFSETPSDLYTYGPNGMAFNERGNLVVAAYDAFVEFSDYGLEFAVYPKVAAEATENLIFDSLGNLYTTTATGGTDKLNQYAAADYAFVQQILLPPGAGQLTGITFDGYGRLYLASQSDNTIHVTDYFSNGFTEFTWLSTLSGAGNPGNFEGLQFNANGQLVAAAGDLVRYDVMSAMKLGTFDGPDDAFPVPLRVDNEGNIYTADYENGGGTVSADIFKFTPAGDFLLKANDPGLFGPFGLAISGTVLAGDPPVEWSYMLAASDPDGDDLTYALVSGPEDMFLDVNTDTLRWYVTSEDIGEHDVELSVDDGHGGVTPQQFTLIVSAG
jgi:hypothetical protein